jgi:hypothetical protein
MSQAKRTPAQKLAQEAARKAFNGIAARQTISERDSTPEFQQNHERLKAERRAREAAEK